MKTPDRFSERSERSTIKAECQKCTVHDASHVRCLQIAGSVSALLDSGLFPSGCTLDENFLPNVELRTSTEMNSTAAEVVVVDIFVKRISATAAAAAVDLLMFVHFSAFHRVQSFVLSKLSSYSSLVSVDDCSSEIGQVDIYGPNSNQILRHTIIPHLSFPSSNTSALLGRMLRLARPSSIPANFSMEILVTDPRAERSSSSSDLSSATKTSTYPTMFSSSDRTAASDMVSRSSDNVHNERRHERRTKFEVGGGGGGGSGGGSGGRVKKRAHHSPELSTRNDIIPMLLLRRSMGGHRTLGEGWKLILPRGCVRVLWNALTLHRHASVPVGTRHLRARSVVLGRPTFPFDYPRTPEGRKWHEWWCRRQQDRLQGDKRRKGRSSVATKNSKKRIKEVKEVKEVKKVKEVKARRETKESKKTKETTETIETKEETRWCWNDLTQDVQRVRVSCCRRGGRLERGALICIPNENDRSQFEKMRGKYHGSEGGCDDGGGGGGGDERVVVGHVTSGGLSHTKSPKGIGIGVMLVREDMKKEQARERGNFYMVRNLASTFYRPADIVFID